MVTGEFPMDDLVRANIFCAEQAIKRMKADNLDCRLACVYDRTGVTSSQGKEILKLSIRMVGLL